MAFRLGKHTVCGEIFNTTPYSVHGWVELRGRDHPLVLQLTGNCSPDLAGWHFRFEARSPLEVPPADELPGDLELLALQQIGPTGTMTAARRVWDTSAGEASSPSRLTATPPKEVRCLYLEWFSQNGRVVIELADPILEFVEYQTAAGQPLADPSTPEASPALLPSAPEDAEEDPFGEAAAEEPEEDEDPDEPEADDPFALFPRDLQRQFDLEARETDWSLQDDADKPPVIREMELMDDLIENSPGVPLSELFDGPLQCPRPDQLQDHEVEEALKTLLAQLALYGVALEICPHFTPREAYRLLLEQICPEERAYPELRNTQWVQHHSTSDYCPQCQAELDRELGDQEHPHHDASPTDSPDDPDDEIEF